MPKIIKPHDYQDDVINNVFKTWSPDLLNICLVAPTGAGKTVIMAFTAKRYIQSNPNKFVLVFAHRDVLLSQISLAFGSIGLPHRMICSRATELMISNSHLEEFGESYLSDKSKIIIVSVPTWIKRDSSSLIPLVGLWMQDEFHHCLRDNMWGKSIEKFGIPTNDEPDLIPAIGLGVTATPLRADGRGLGRHADGLADTIIKTPGMGELIQMGRLSNYKVYAPPATIDLTGVNITASGDYNQQKLAKATDKKSITGKAVEHYLMLGRGKQGIVFAASIKHSDHVAADFRDAGITAVSLSSKTNAAVRQAEIRKFRQGRTQLLINYDLFGEGFDVPAVEIVIMLRKTLSYSLFKQMFGRCLRVLDGKLFGILLDHVGNVAEHILPGKHLHEDPEWTLDRQTKKSSSKKGDILMRICPQCFYYYAPPTNNIKSFVCPDCGHSESDNERNATQKEIQIKDGVLVEFDTGFFKEVMEKIAKVDTPVDVFKRKMRNAPPVVIHSATNKHIARQEAQKTLREWIIHWCNEVGLHKGLDVSVTQSEFNRCFGTDVFTAQAMGATAANDLTDKIKLHLIEYRLFG